MQYLYVVKCQSFFKIGIAVDVESRLAQLSTGNPFALELFASYKFENATAIEAVLHQKFSKSRQRGEWYELDKTAIDELMQICELLGGRDEVVDGTVESTEDQIEEAEEISQPTDGAKWDYPAMFADGWRMERNGGKEAAGRYWLWRKGSDAGRKSLYGGMVSELPFPLEEMRLRYDKK